MIPPLTFEPHDPNRPPPFPPLLGAYAAVVGRVRPDGSLDDIIRVDAVLADGSVPGVIDGMAYALTVAADRIRSEGPPLQA